MIDVFLIVFGEIINTILVIIAEAIAQALGINKNPKTSDNPRIKKAVRIFSILIVLIFLCLVVFLIWKNN